ncbi:NAD(P)H-dependent oxidoreductase [Pseudoalteromonas ardens]|uniref:FMN reductase n=1 Tax=Pseudoalteromonas rubra TaxID=43658 RepID=A0A0L0EW73_9GAMM|nr:NAD(P)H-dependent oxidoreductase [Pseudoalteromonas sp. R96]KNC68098.1 FMN reductase [Pseudoalteromonas rubra]MDK1311340.1 NAD(P)H-dependent oxidoreductase [Pseudoalteromonas sp. R96]
MNKVVVISGHPDLAASNTNRVILDEISQAVSEVEIRRLDECYPDFNIDVEAEQQALLSADVIVLQFPFYWYSVPALLKKWLDDVLSYNFAYGASGDKLKGKACILSFTVGGPESSYDPLGYNHFKIEQMIRPLQQTVYLTGMQFIEPVYTHGMVYIPGVYNELSDVQSKAKAHAARLCERIHNVIHDPAIQIERFVGEWFSRFDVLPADCAEFTRSLSQDITLDMMGDQYQGHEGFRDWYTTARRTFKPGCEHLVEQIEVREKSKESYRVELRIRLIAETYSDSPLGGQAVNLLVNEVWQVNLVGNLVQITDYQVMAVEQAK